MSYCVFMHRPDTIYNDSPAEQYQFPKMYLGRAEGCVGDWIVYLEPKKVPQSRGYFAIARVQQIIPDPKALDMYLAIIEPGSYLDFARNVAFSTAKVPIERGLLNDRGRLSGWAQAAVRPISPTDFARIVELGLDDRDPILPREGEPPPVPGVGDIPIPYAFEQVRTRIQQLTSRIARDRVFRKIVLRAYDERCAVTGLKLVNGGGCAEVHAAHIRPVEANGPDIVTNGIALSGTAHWMFDRGLISLTDDLQILISRQMNDAESIRGFVNRTGYAYSPTQASARPHPHFLHWHRENCFKQ